jgi:hypothetical protein
MQIAATSKQAGVVLCVRSSSVKRVASAVGEGSIAASQMYQYLQEQARKT